jgi:hypothetical protein
VLRHRPSPHFFNHMSRTYTRNCSEIIELPPSALQGLKEGVADKMLAGETMYGGLDRTGGAASSQQQLAISIISSTAVEEQGESSNSRPTTAAAPPHAMGEEQQLGLSCQADSCATLAPSHALVRPTRADLGVKTVAELGNWSHYRLAKAILTLSEVEVGGWTGGWGGHSGAPSALAPACVSAPPACLSLLQLNFDAPQPETNPIPP